MIEKMKFLTLSGPRTDLDRVIYKYLVHYDIQYESISKEFNDINSKTYFPTENPYKNHLEMSNELISYLDTKQPDLKKMDIDIALFTVKTLSKQIEQSKEHIASLTKELEQAEDFLQTIKPFISLDLNLSYVKRLNFLSIQFGRFPTLYYEKFNRYVYNYINSVFYPCLVEQEYVYGIYLVLKSESETIGDVYHSLHFQSLNLPLNYDETPSQIVKKLQTKTQELKKEILQKQNDMISILKAKRLEILSAHETIAFYHKYYDIRKFCTCFGNELLHTDIYTLSGFISEQEIGHLSSDLERDSKVFLSLEDADSSHGEIPTKLKNPAIFRPFEMFLRMYGMPSYHELDPTIFVAITYSFMFGMMFGDVGQGLCLVIGGFLLYHFRHMSIAGAISLAGCFSTVFGFLYGSFFGFENLPWLPALWLNPMENVMVVLIVSIVFGAGLILIAMILHMINGKRKHQIIEMLLDPSGVAGFLFYGTVLLLIFSIVTKHSIPSTLGLVLLLGIPLLFMFFREPIIRFVHKKKELIPESKAMFLLEGIVELFEILLSYITNTISFVRVGAFSLSHAGMMGVVLSLAHVEEGHPNFIVIILGNILVAGLEGLIVGIQVLRLEYYEMFSRFYNGTGKEFKPY